MVWNITVDTAHTYFVGEGEWLVHNDCPLQYRARGGSQFWYEPLDDLGRAQGAYGRLELPLDPLSGRPARSIFRGLDEWDYHSFDRTHLMPREVGGQNGSRNLVIGDRNFNQQTLVYYEQLVVDAVNSGDVVRYSVDAIYHPSNQSFIPDALTLWGKSDSGQVNFFVTLFNQ